MSLPILYQDDHVVVVNKTSGLLVHRSLIDTRATEFAMQMVRDQVNKPVYLVHRLDRGTSGALLLAFSSSTAQFMNRQFSEGNVQKTYVAVVRGIAPEKETINYPLKEELDRKSDKLARTDKPAQSAITHIKRLSTCELPFRVDRYPTSRYSLVEAKPLTGRKHQIRRHLRHIGHPIVGDVTHGVGKHNRFFENQFNIRRLLLACTELSFTHPETKELMTVAAPLPENFTNLLLHLGLTTH